MTPNFCVSCGGKFLYGEPPYSMDQNDGPTLWCRDCIEGYTYMIWPDDRGPYPITVYPRMRPQRNDA